MRTPSSIGVTVKKGDERGYQLARRMLEFIERVLGFTALLDVELAYDVGWDKTFVVGEDHVDALVVIGGDGTLFRTLHRLGWRCDTPVLTVKLGRRAFLLDIAQEEALERLKDFAAGRYRIEEYIRLEVTWGEDRRAPPVLNDVVLSSWGTPKAKVVGLSVYVDDEHLYSFKGDGLIVATPIGSTAYTLSAGGPIVDTKVGALVITPIAPLQFYAKPVVASSSSIVKVRVAEDSGPVAVVVDGQPLEALGPGEEVTARSSQCTAKIVRFRRLSVYERLRQGCRE